MTMPALRQRLKSARPLLVRYGSLLGSRFALLAALCFALAIVVFYACQWGWLRSAVAALLTAALRASGLPATRSLYEISVGGLRVAITPECTYVDWFLCAAPWIWRRGPLANNLLRVIALAAGVGAANFLRLYLAICGALAGLPWWAAHDVPDYILWYPGVVLAFLFWLRAAAASAAPASRDLQAAA